MIFKLFHKLFIVLQTRKFSERAVVKDFVRPHKYVAEDLKCVMISVITEMLMCHWSYSLHTIFHETGRAYHFFCLLVLKRFYDIYSDIHTSTDLIIQTLFMLILNWPTKHPLIRVMRKFEERGTRRRYYTLLTTDN